jgi:4-amino-4-deoxy-L-arabinose transferase-like glycosyltransferase
VILASAFAWSILFIATPAARQDFPLIDDWAFGRGAFRFARGEGIHYSNWSSMPQLGQWLWACPFIWLLGPTFFALRLSTLTLSWLGLWAFDDLLRQQGWPAGRAALATAIMAFHPLFFLLEGTFMTDVPALSLALVALTLYVRALRRPRLAWLVGAALVASVAAITRQNTVAVPIIAAYLLAREANLRRCAWWWIGVLVPILVGAAVHFWHQSRPDIIAVEPRVLPPHRLLLLPYLVIHWCGLTTLPLLLSRTQTGSRRAFGIVFVVLILMAGYWLHQGTLMSELDGLIPYTSGVVSPWGAGPGELCAGERPILLSWPLRGILTAVGCLGAAAFLVRASAWDRRALAANPLLLFSFSQIFFVLIAPELWDRYLLPVVVPGSLVLVEPVAPGPEAEPLPRWRRALAAALLVLTALFSTAVMHDWLAENATLWDLGRQAVAEGVDPLAIEGGLEWDGWHAAARQPPRRRRWRELFSPLALAKTANHPRGLTLPFTRVWFPAITGQYALSYTPIEGAVVVRTQPYRLWLLPGERRIYLLREGH